MVHRICSATEPQIPYFTRLWRTLFAPTLDPTTRLERLFEQETDEFDLKFAFLSAIDREQDTERLVTTHGSYKTLKPDSVVPLSNTYCRKTIAIPEGTLAVNDALAEGWEDDAAYETFGFESYLGTTVSVDDQFYGTLCFVDPVARAEPFLEEEKALLELHSEWVGYSLTLWDGPLFRETPIDTVEGRAVSSEDIDSMMDALKTRRRRTVLLTLVGDATETSIETLQRRMTAESDNIPLQLHHIDLPRLADAGYIEWDQDEGTVTRGPEFSEVEPLLKLLQDYSTGSFQ